MMIPEPLRRKVTGVFGARGVEWLSQSKDLTESVIKNWRLTDVQISSVLSHNLVCFAVSPVYGQVALKIGVPHDELFREMETLRIYDGHVACRMYECDRTAGAMLLERILPGTYLWQLSDRSERILVAGGLLRCLRAKPHTAQGIPLHRDVVRRTFRRVLSLSGLGDGMSGLMEAAENAEQEIRAEKTDCDMLLHGDLNHWNILRNGSNHWRVIDPQGFIGPAVLDAGRFVLNELTYGESPCTEKELPGLLCALAEAMGADTRDVWRSAMIDAVLSTCWHFEDGAAAEKMVRHMQICNVIMRSGEGIF